jgi:hypothetical protein
MSEDRKADVVMAICFAVTLYLAWIMFGDY